MSNQNGFTRREFLSIGALAAVGSLMTEGLGSQVPPGSANLLLYVGTYTSNTKSDGIYVCAFDRNTGKLSVRDSVKGVADPSFLTIDRNHHYLLAVNELVDYDGKPGGSVSSFRIDKKSGSLMFINKQPSVGAAPCHVAVSDNGRFALVANYVGGNISVLPIGNQGMLGPAIQVMQHFGAGPNKDRQLGPHAHSITLDHANRYAFAADLGTDKLMIYAFDTKTGKLTPNHDQPYFQTKPGAGPRHFAFHPNGRLAFLINELDSTLTSLSYNKTLGTLKEIHTSPTLSTDFPGLNACADVHVSPDGKFVYGSNRGSDSIVMFRIDERRGMIKGGDNTPTGGRRPRNFVIDPTGNFLLAANQDSDSINVFKIDRATGDLKPTGYTVSVPAPVCLKFGPLSRENEV